MRRLLVWVRVAGVAVCCVLGGWLFAAPALAAAPAVLGESVSGVTPFEAHLEAVVNAGEETSECHFQWGTASVGEHEEECEQGNALGGGEQGVGRTITGLEQATYHYRVIVKNATGVAEGAEERFTPLALLAPAVSGLAASAITPTRAHLEAAVNPDYQSSTCVFEYRRQGAASFEPGVGCEQGNALNGGEQPVSASITGLAPETVYEFRLAATNATGAATDAPATFTTNGRPLLSIAASGRITRTSVTLLGSVNPQASTTAYQIEYATTANYGQLTSPVSVGEGNTAVPIEVGLEGLVPGTTYHYALIATNEAGTHISPDQTFTTSPPTPPIVANGGQASNVTINTTTLTGTINPEGLETSYVLELGTDTAYGTSIAGEVGAATQPIRVEVPIINLEPGTLYHYRFLAISSDGRTNGPDETFTTPAYEHPIALPTIQPQLTTPTVAFPTEESQQITTKHPKHKAKKRKRRRGAGSRRGAKPKRKQSKAHHR
jgi:hypothetical protein